MKKLIYLLLLIISIVLIGVAVFKLKIAKNTTITFNNENLKIEDSPFYKKYYNSRNIVVVNIWATWCEPCIDEIPELNKVKKEYNRDGLDFISFSIDNTSDIEKVKQFVASKKFEWNDITIQNLKYKKHLENMFYNKSSNSNIIQVTSFEIPRTLIFRDKKLIKEYNGLINYHDICDFLNRELQKN
ncbi:TlpA family protein disulfide reductase [Chryseobacterium sp. PBS4-4]|uniref:TlpA family protein disulfide reductase n=1 Tax=Chryseobacterium edaphi TaxID=2976532 RepID=A0ABT2W587_9FLAO|nr:TlpA family protein disulfide reductase [Chryseobacterium edaphi]MCU7617379.1 TlpA family protein disulfide reductase [Chryseobacterium edaphi]